MTTSTAAEFGGRLKIRLGVSNGRVSTVNVSSSRLADAARVFCGRSPDDVVDSLGRLFSLCGRAQTVCGLAAVEQAQGRQCSAGQTVARDILRQAEMLSQTAMRIGLDWPRLLGCDGDPGLARLCLAAEAQLERALFGGADWKVPGGVATNPDVDAVRAIVQQIRKAVHEENLWSQLSGALEAMHLNAFGKCEKIGDGALRRRFETPGVQGAIKTYGAGLRAQLEARLADLHRLPDEMLANVEDLGPVGAVVVAPTKHGRGQACVETARGPLTHKVVIQEGLVQAYDIVAPTDSNFAPEGAVSLGLQGADASNMDALIRAAELYVLALDPCVECTVEVGYA